MLLLLEGVPPPLPPPPPTHTQTQLCSPTPPKKAHLLPAPPPACASPGGPGVPQTGHPLQADPPAHPCPHEPTPEGGGGHSKVAKQQRQCYEFIDAASAVQCVPAPLPTRPSTCAGRQRSTHNKASSSKDSVVSSSKVHRCTHCRQTHQRTPAHTSQHLKEGGGCTGTHKVRFGRMKHSVEDWKTVKED
jgi:hypothetical protein